MDLAGRLLPRLRALQLRSGPGVLGLAAADVVAAGLFFAYIVLPPGLQHLRHDAVPVALVVFLWLTGEGRGGGDGRGSCLHCEAAEKRQR